MADQQLLKPIATQVRLLSSIAGLLLNQGPGKAYTKLAARAADMIKSIESVLQEAQARGLGLDTGAVQRLAAVIQKAMVFLSQLQTRNIVGNLLQLPQDQAQVKSINTEMRNVQLEIQRPLIEAMERDPRVFNQRMYAIEDRITENGDDLEDALAQDEERWKQIASERSEGMDEDRENLAIQLQVPNNKLAEEIRKLKEGIKNAPEGPIREFLKKALSDYRVSRTIQAMNVTADVCFAVDCTGSMGTFLGYTKQIVKELLAELRRNFPYVSVRMAFVGYRDFDDYGSPSYEVVPFGTVETVSPQLEGVEALSGFGGDWAEDVLGGLKKCISLNWRPEAHSRILIHLLDAPPHGKQFRDFGPQQDRYYEDDKADPAGVRPNDYRDILTELIAVKKVDYYFFALNKTTRGTEKLFADHIQTIHNGVFDVTFLEAQAGKPPDYATFLKKVLKSTSESIYASFASYQRNTLELPPDAY